MSSAAHDDSLRVTPAEMQARLDEELTMIDWRALIVVVVAEPGLENQADEACEAAIAAHEIPNDQVLKWPVRRDATGREQLRAYNRGRDSFVAKKRLIYLRAGSAADIRFLRSVAPDLTASIDVFVELRGEPEVQDHDGWAECSRAIRALMEDRHGTLDFTGLLPATVDQRVLPLDQLYQPLVDPRAVANVLEASDELDTGTGTAKGWLVLGHPGTGKTTFVRHLAWTYAHDRADPLKVGPKVPMLVSLSDYGYEREHDRVLRLVEFLPRWLANQGIAHASALTSNLSEVVLLLDGLDELRSPDARRSVLAEVGDLLRDGRVGAVVLTGRSFLVDELRKQDHALQIVVTTAPSLAQMRAFVQTFVRLRQGADAHAEQLIATIEGDPDLRALARTPLMLAFMVILDELEGRLPDRRIEIYYRLGEMLLDRWTRARSIGASSARHERPTRADALRVVGPLAWWTLERAGSAVPEQALLQEIEQLEARRDTPAEANRRAAALLELLRSDTALLVPLPGPCWSFVHQSIAEYFAGIEVERDPERWDRLLADPFRPEWREVVLFCAGQLGVIEGRVDRLDRLIEAVLSKSSRPGRYDAKYPSLLMGLLGESPGLSRRQIDRLVKRLVEFVFTTAFSRAATVQIQIEFVVLMHGARGAVSESLGEELRALFSTRAGSIRWDRVFTRPDPIDRSPTGIFAQLTIGWLVRLLIGPLVESLVAPWVGDHDIDLQPTLNHWANQTANAYRLATWWVTSGPDDRVRLFAEIVEQLPVRSPSA